MATVALSGSIITGATEKKVVDGGETLILTLTGSTWAEDIGMDSQSTADLITNIDSAQAEATGWDAKVKTALTYRNVVRNSSTVVTITFPAVTAYDITANETITVTVPASAQGNSTTATAGTFTPTGITTAVNDAIWRAKTRYNLPRWFLYAVAKRESSFDPNTLNAADGGKGLMQLTGNMAQGITYPENLAVIDNSNTQWRYDEGLNLGPPFVDRESKVGWIDMKNVTPLSDAYDSDQNLSRYCSVYGAPAFYLFKKIYSLNDANTLRAVAYHWFYGLPYNSSRKYDSTETTYLGPYDTNVTEYQASVEADDGVWNGKPII